MVNPDASRPGFEDWPPGTLMANLSESTAAALLALAPATEVASGEVLMRQGDRTTSVCLLRQTRGPELAYVKITAVVENGAESLLGIRGHGEIVGEMSAFLDGQRTATVTACTPMLVHSIRQETFQRFLRERPDASLALSRMFAERLGSANRRRLDFAGYDIPIRLARVVVELVSRFGQPRTDGYHLAIRLTQPEFGRLIGASEDSVGQAMNRLRDARLITTGYASLTVRDLPGLRKFADLE